MFISNCIMHYKMSSTYERVRGCLERKRESRQLKLAIVFATLLLDNLLFTVVVPIIPNYLLVLDEQNTDGLAKYNSTDFSKDTLKLSHLTTHSSNNGLHRDGDNSSNSGQHFDKQSYLKENSRIGWLLSSKAITQLLANPLVGPLTNRYGYNIPMFIGVVVLLTSNLLYAFGESYAVMFVARASQGIASSSIAIAGMSMLAHIYPDDMERSKAMGIALGGSAFGVLVGFPFGGVMYQFVGKRQAFLVIAVFIVIEAAIQLWALTPSLKVQTTKVGTALTVLLKDPYILVTVGAILFPDMAIAMLEPTLPIWMLETMHPENWQLGVVFVPDSLGFFIGCNIFGVVAVKLGRWRVAMVALVLMGVCLLCIPFATRMVHLLVPHFCMGLAIGMVDAAMMPMLALLVDKRHVAIYGNVYAIGQISINLGFAIGPAFAGQMVELIGFAWLIRAIAIVNILYTPVCYFLRDPPDSDEHATLMTQEHLNSYHSNDEESFSYKQLREE